MTNQVRFHRVLVLAVAEGLSAIFGDVQYADKVVEKLLRKDARWGARDRAFIAEQTYNAVRWWRLWWAVADEKPSFSELKLVRLIGIQLASTGAILPDWPEWAGINTDWVQARIKEVSSNRAVKHAIPDWLDEYGFEAYADHWEAEITALNQTADVIIRANRLRNTTIDLSQKLLTEGWETSQIESLPDALRVHKRGNITATAAFKAGLFEVQDGGSQYIAPFLRAEAGMHVVDACAGAGGKTLHLANIMQNKGSILALDVEEPKLMTLRTRAKRNGATNIETRHIGSPKTIERLIDSADRLLLDVPCSGLGVLRRNPDAKWKLSPDFLTAVQVKQYDILQRYSKMVKPEGLMVYATCSILPDENQHQVKRFLEAAAPFELIDEAHVTSAKYGFDGFYMALLQKKNRL